MFCTKCGTEVIKESKFCYKCGFDVSSLKNIIEHDEVIDNRNLIEERHNQVAEVNTINFSVFNRKISFSTPLREHIEIQAIFLRNIESQLDQYSIYYNNNIKSLDKLLNKGISDANSIIIETIKNGIYILTQLDILDYDYKRLVEEYHYRFDLTVYLSDLVSKLEQVEQFSLNLQQQRQYERSSRSRWRGGGFGLSGAIKGAMMAGALNAGTGLLRGIGDGITNSSDRSKIENMKSKIFNDPSTKQSVLNGVRNCTQNVIDVVMKILNNKGILGSFNIDFNGIDSKFRNIVYMIENKTLSIENGLDEIVKLIEENPFNVEYLLTLYILKRDEKREVFELAKYLGYDNKYLKWITNYDMETWNKIKPKEGSTLNELNNSLGLANLINLSNPKLEAKNYPDIIAVAINEEQDRLNIKERLQLIQNNNKDFCKQTDTLIEVGNVFKAFEMIKDKNGYIEYLIEKYYMDSLKEAFNGQLIDDMEDEFEEIISMTIDKDDYTRKYANYLMSKISTVMYSRKSRNDVMYEKALKEILKVSAFNIISALETIGYYKIIGLESLGIKKNISEGVEILKQQAFRNNPNAMFRLGRLYRMGENVNIDRSLSKIYLEAAKEYGHPYVCKELELLNKRSTKSDDGGCFITSAVLKSLNVEDDSYELRQFRDFRDNWLLIQPNGKKIIAEYYDISTVIVKEIEKSKDSSQIYKDIWNYYLSPCLSMIETSKFEECKQLYTNMVLYLKNEYYNEKEICNG